MSVSQANAAATAAAAGRQPAGRKDPAKNGRIFTGVPFGSRKSRSKLMDHLRARFQDPGGDQKKTDAAIDAYIHNHNSMMTDKSAAALQCVSVAAAVEAFFLTQPNNPVIPYDPWVGHVALGAFAVCAFLLLFNLHLFWPRIWVNAATRDADLERRRLSLLRVMQRRSLRHTLAIYLLMLGFGTSFADRIWESWAMRQPVPEIGAGTNPGSPPVPAASPTTPEDSPAPLPTARPPASVTRSAPAPSSNAEDAAAQPQAQDETPPSMSETPATTEAQPPAQ